VENNKSKWQPFLSLKVKPGTFVEFFFCEQGKVDKYDDTLSAEIGCTAVDIAGLERSVRTMGWDSLSHFSKDTGAEATELLGKPFSILHGRCYIEDDRIMVNLSRTNPVTGEIE